MDISDTEGNLFVFVLAALACSKRSVGEDGIKKSDGVGAGRENEIPLYSNPSFMKIIFIFSCSGMFRNVPECSGMFRHVPECSVFRVLSTAKATSP